MASTFTTLGIEKMATGENAGTWGDKTNTNLDIVNTAIAGYVEQSIAGGAATTALTITDGAATSVAQNAVIKLTGTISGNQIVTVPNSIEKVYIVANGTSGAHTVQFKTVSGTGVTFGTSDKGTKLFFVDGTNVVDAGLGGATDLNGEEFVLDEDGDTSLTADTDDQIDIRIAGTDQLTIKDGAFSPVTTNDIDLGTASLEFKNAFFDGTVTSDAFAGPLTGNVTGNVSGTAATVTTAAQSNITSLGTLTTLTVDNVITNGSTIGHTSDIDLITLADGIVTVAGEVSMTTLDIGGTNVTSTAAELNILDGVNSTAAELNALDGITAVVGELNALDIGSTAVGTAVASKAVILDSNKDYTGIRNLTLTGDLTVGGDDITMGTNTAGNLLVADGTNFNSIAVSSLAEISTAASGDIFLAIDASGGGLKKIARSAVVAGLATDSAIANVVDDTSPQLGGNLDMNGADIITTSNATIDLAPNGTGTVVVRGNSNSGAIVFNCESNSHGQKVIAQPHSAGVTNTMLLPDGANSTLVSLVATQTLTNKTLTSPKINENVAVTATASELNILDGVTSTAAELNALDGITAVVGELNALDIGSTAVGTAVASKAVILDSNKDYTGFRNITLSGELDAATLDISGAIDIAGASQFSGAVTVGVDDTGLDVKFFGASAGAYFEWDQSADQLRILGASADATTSTGKLLLATALTDINANDVMGKVDFQAPLEAGGTDAITIAASIQAVAQATFSSSVNATDLLFFTGHSEAATEKFRFTSQGEIGIAGNNVGSDGQVLTSGGAGAAAAWEDAAGAPAADDITAGDAAVSIATSSGAVVVDSNASTVTIDGHTGVTIAASSSGNITLDSEVDISLDANGGDIFVKDAGTTFGSLTNTSGNLIIKSGTTTAATFSGANVTFAGTLASGAITASGDILPSADDAKDLGSASKQWRNIYTGDLHLSNKSKAEGNVVDGTTGDWTIQEGEENLYILNNKSGKKYKFNLTEV